mgnify:FL=1
MLIKYREFVFLSWAELITIFISAEFSEQIAIVFSCCWVLTVSNCCSIFSSIRFVSSELSKVLPIGVGTDGWLHPKVNAMASIAPILNGVFRATQKFRFSIDSDVW